MNLWQWSIGEVFVWELIRVKFFIGVQEKISQENFDKNTISNVKGRSFNFLQRLWKNEVLRNPFLNFRKYDALVFESGRKYKIGEKYVDIYTWFLRKELVGTGKLTEVYETNFAYDHLSDAPKKVRHIDFLKHLARLISKFINIPISEKDYVIIQQIERKVQIDLGVSYPIRLLIENEYKRFVAEEKLYRALIKLKKPKEIFIVNYVEYLALTSAAKKAGVVITELQHGLIIEEALTYHFPKAEKDSLKYFPNKFMCWKSFKHNTGVLPISSENIIYSDSNHLTFMQKQFEDVTRNPFAILVASQPFFSEKIRDFILRSAVEMPDYIFYYKLHPMEFASFGTTEVGKKLSNLANVKIISNEESIYKLMKYCHFIVGIYSTSLFEADIFGCKPVVLANIHPLTSTLEMNRDTIAVDPNKKLNDYLR